MGSASRYVMLMVLLLAPLAPLPTGCPGGVAGGGVAVSGLVVDATNTGLGIGGAQLYVYVPHRPSSLGGRQTAAELITSATSAPDGSYSLTGVPGGTFEFLITPPEQSAYTGSKFDMTVSGQENIPKNMKLVPTAVATEVIGVGVAPVSATVAPGATQQFGAGVLDQSGNFRTDVSPTWVVTGNIGTINDNGLLKAGSQEGSGFVAAIVADNVGFAAVSVVSVPSGTPEITATLTASPTTGFAPLPVSFTGAATTTRPDIPITQYVLSLGDGTPDWTGTTPPSNLPHTYASAGTFAATLTARDSQGTTGSASVVIEVQPALAVGGRIAFASTRSGNWEIYLMSTDGTAVTQVTNNPATDCTPAWSHDGTKIAFQSTRDANWDIYVMNGDGTGVTRLTRDPAIDEHPAWSPDGTKIAFTFRADVPRGEIYVMNPDGTGRMNLTNDPIYNDDGPSWSPDGTKIAFHSNRDGNYEIYLMNADGTGQRNLTNTTTNEFFPAWSPDGTKIAFRMGASLTSSDIYVINADGTGQTRLTNSPFNPSEAPTWSPDGTQIAFRGAASLGSTDIYVLNANGTGLVDLTSNPADDGWPAWSPVP